MCNSISSKIINFLGGGVAIYNISDFKMYLWYSLLIAESQGANPEKMEEQGRYFQ